MKHTLLTRFFNLIAAVALMTGVGLSVQGNLFYASLTSHGSMVTERSMPLDTTLKSAAFIPYEYGYEQTQAAANLALGMLLIVLGFFIHGLVRMRQEHTVPIKIVPSKKKPLNWFWVEMKM